MRPADEDIEATYQSAEGRGLTREQVDVIAVPMISVLGGATSLRSVRSHGELRAIQNQIDIEARAIRARSVAKDGKKLATPRQVSYILDLLSSRRRDGVAGGFMTGPTTKNEIELMTRDDASLYIASLREQY